MYNCRVILVISTLRGPFGPSLPHCSLFSFFSLCVVYVQFSLLLDFIVFLMFLCCLLA